MPKTQLSWDEIFAEAPLSEPLTTYKDNIQAIINLIGTSLVAIQEREESTQKLFKDVEGFVEELKNSIPDFIEGRNEQTKSLRELRALKKRLPPTISKETFLELDTAIKEISDFRKNAQNAIRKTKRRYKHYNSFCTELAEELRTHKLERELLIPMSFVYLVTVWDAFIFDTARKILHVHPNLISDSTKTIEVSKSALWGLGANELHDYLIDLEVRNLDSDRKKLLNCFREHWGIDWEKSSVPLNEIIEIRARRDIWVHNKGVVNQQYISMLGDSATLKSGQLAEITDMYLGESLAKLNILAIYIHKGAHKKHYSKADSQA